MYQEEVLKMRIRPFDLLGATGMLFFIVFAALVQYDRFVRYRGKANVLEFFIYAVLISVVIYLLWIVFRNYDWEPWVLVMMAGGIFLHTAGGLPIEDGVRIYDCLVLGIRFDKFVHVFNAFVAARVVMVIFRFEKVSLGRLEGLAVVLIVLGLGACWEIAEYVVVRTIPHNGVGRYDNNMLDLIANLFGSVCSRLVFAPPWRSIVVPAVDRGCRP